MRVLVRLDRGMSTVEPAPRAKELPSDEALMAAYQRGDARALGSLFERYSSPVRRLLSRMVGPFADDVTQTTFLSLVRASDRFREGARFRPWLYAIAVNAARD